MSAAEAAMQAARLGDPVQHKLGKAIGMLAGALAGAALVAVTIGTGGAALPFIIGAAAVGGMAGAKAAEGAEAAGMFDSGTVTGALNPPCSANVTIGSKPAARAEIDTALCSGLKVLFHLEKPATRIAEGSATVLINGLPAARQGDRLQCSGDIQIGEPTVLIGGGTAQVLPIEKTFVDYVEAALPYVAVGSFILGAGIVAWPAILNGATNIAILASTLSPEVILISSCILGYTLMETSWEEASPWVHGGLDLIGLIPVFGEIADGINAVIYLAEGNFTDALLSAAAMIPVAGWGAVAAKWGRKGVKALKFGKKAKTAVDWAKRGKKALQILSNVAKGKKLEGVIDGVTLGVELLLKTKRGQAIIKRASKWADDGVKWIKKGRDKAIKLKNRASKWAVESAKNLKSKAVKLKNNVVEGAIKTRDKAIRLKNQASKWAVESAKKLKNKRLKLKKKLQDSWKKRKKKKQISKNRKDGKRREEETKTELKNKHPDASIQNEQYLRDTNGNIAKDPITGEGRRIDHVVIKDKEVVETVETTSTKVNKSNQLAKELRIRKSGGNFIKDRETGQLIDLKDIPISRIDAKP